jgi:hypothetical protein
VNAMEQAIGIIIAGALIAPRILLTLLLCDC